MGVAGTDSLGKPRPRPQPLRDRSVYLADHPPADPFPDALLAVSAAVGQALGRAAGQPSQLLAGADGAAGARRDPRFGARCAGGGGFGSPESQARLAPGLERDRLDAEARDPARGRPRGLRQRLRDRKPAGHAGGLRPLGQLRAGHAPLPGAAEHRTGEAGAGQPAGELRTLPRRPPGEAVGAPFGGP